MAESKDDTNVIDFTSKLMSGQLEEAVAPEGVEMTEWTFSNDKSNVAIRQMFHTLYHSVFVNKAGLMHAKNRTTGEIDTLIVGLEVTPEGILTFPLARVLNAAEQEEYQAPDGNGGYID